jgi:hypothetical protein
MSKGKLDVEYIEKGFTTGNGLVWSCKHSWLGKTFNVEKKKGKKSVDKSTKKPLWDLSKLEISDYFSCISYLKVEKIEGNQITVKNYNGGKWLISKDLLERDMWSGEHFE